MTRALRQLPLGSHVKRVANLDTVRDVLVRHTAVRVVWPDGPTSYARRGILLDATTASAIVTVHDALNPENQRLFAAMLSDSKARFLKAATWALGTCGAPRVS